MTLLSPQAEGERWGCDVAPWRPGRGQSLGFFTDDSDSDSEHGVPKQCYKVLGGVPLSGGWGEGGVPQTWPCPPDVAVSPKRGHVPPQLGEPQRFPGFLLFLCRLLSPVLHAYGRAVQFLHRPPWPLPGRTPRPGEPRGTPWGTEAGLQPRRWGLSPLPTAEQDCVEALLEFLAEDEDGESGGVLL